MKDFYYILGVKPDATQEDIRKAYRKLSIKFHPDKNDGDEFFTERFKEIQEAFETLDNTVRRKNYDLRKSTSAPTSTSSGMNFQPFIESFVSNKKSFEYGEEITFSWKTINADKVFLKPFGAVQPIGQATYKLKNFKNQSLCFGLIAENSNINKKTEESIIIKNLTYDSLYLHFKAKISEDEILKQKIEQAENEVSVKSTRRQEIEKFIALLIIIAVILFIALKASMA